MSSSGPRAAVFRFPITLVSIAVFSTVIACQPSAAQSSSYHLEFDGHAISQQAFLVNDSEKLIEAYGASQLCFKPRTYSGFPDDSRDILDSPGGFGWGVILAADGSPSRSGILEPGGRWRTHMVIIPEKEDCQTQINAVLFSDGSFEGEDEGVRGLKAKRDGLADAIHYWADRISHEKPDGSTLAALHDELKKRKAEDQTKRTKYLSQVQRHLSFEGGESPIPPPMLSLYWSGWGSVEGGLELLLSQYSSQEKPAENFRKFANEINSWKAKIDGNSALQKLNVVFPPITESGDTQ